MNHRILDPNDPDDLLMIKSIIMEEECEQESNLDSHEEGFLPRKSDFALKLQFYSMIWFNYYSEI
jgi:hypothetical protein